MFLDTDLTEEEIQDYCNQYLPEDIGVNSVRKAGERFHARYLATGKIYRYSCHIGKNKTEKDQYIIYDILGKIRRYSKENIFIIWKKNRI